MGIIESVAIIGTGPVGAIALSALAEEKAFSTLRGLREERRQGDVGKLR